MVIKLKTIFFIAILILLFTFISAQTINCESKPGVPVPSPLVTISQNNEIVYQGFSEKYINNKQNYCWAEWFK